MMRRFNSGMRKYYSGLYGNQYLNAQNNAGYVSPEYMSNYMGGLQDTSGQPTGVDVTNSVQAAPITPNAPAAGAGLTSAGINSIGQTALSFMPKKGPEGKVLSGIAGSALTTGAAANAGALGSGALASGVGAAALPVAGVAAGLLVANQVSKAVAGEQDEYGVYKKDSKGVWGGAGNVADTMAKGRNLANNSQDYAYLTGESSGAIKSLGRVSQVPVFGTISNGREINRLRRLARDRTINLNQQQQDFQEGLEFSDTKQGNLDRYGSTFATGGNLGKSNSTFFKAGGSTHENGGVSIGDNKEIEKNEVVYKGYVFSDRLPYRK